MKQQPTSKLAAAAACLCLFAQVSQAQEGPTIRWSGFGTVGVVHSSEKNADFTSSNAQPSGAGFTRSVSFDPDTKLGAQADVKFGNSLSATVQVLARQRYDNSYTPEVMMAFGKWQALPQLNVRVGRLPFQVFLLSDYRSIGYSQTTIRPPVEMYHIFSLYHIDGADLTYGTSLGDVALKGQIFGGKTKEKQPNATVVSESPAWGGSVVAEAGELTVRASYLHANVSLTQPAMDAAFLGIRYGLPANALFPGSPAMPGDAALADLYEPKDAGVGYTSVGFNYDAGRWFLTGEYAAIAEASISPRMRTAYLTAGLRVGAFTPYATYGTISTGTSRPATSHPVLEGIRAASLAVGQSTASVGVRWDAMKNVAVKAQYDHAKPDSGTVGRLSNVQAGHQAGAAYNVLSLAVDFVF